MLRRASSYGDSPSFLFSLSLSLILIIDAMNSAGCTRLYTAWRLPNVRVNGTATTIMRDSNEAPSFNETRRRRLEERLAIFLRYVPSRRAARTRPALNCSAKDRRPDRGAKDKNSSRTGRMRGISLLYRWHGSASTSINCRDRDLDDHRSRTAPCAFWQPLLALRSIISRLSRDCNDYLTFHTFSFAFVRLVLRSENRGSARVVRISGF